MKHRLRIFAPVLLITTLTYSRESRATTTCYDIYGNPATPSTADSYPTFAYCNNILGGTVFQNNTAAVLIQEQGDVVSYPGSTALQTMSIYNTAIVAQTTYGPFSVFSDNTGTGVGVWGQSAGGNGVVGLSGGSAYVGPTAGVVGAAGASGVIGVVGVSLDADGGYFTTNASTHNGVHGGATTGNGVYGSSSSGNGVLGITSGATSPAGVTAGVVGAGNGSGVYGVWGASTNTDAVVGEDSSNGNGVYGSSAGTGAGVRGYSVSGDGVYGLGNASGQAGVYGHTQASSGGYGVYGDGGTYGTGVYATASGTYSIGAQSQCSGSDCFAVEASCSGTGCLAGYFSGSVTVTGTFSNPSDERLKKAIVAEESGLDDLLRLRPVTFFWREPAKHGGEAGIQHGFIAQDVQKVFPEWVRTGADGFLTLDKTQLDGLEVQAIRTLNDKNRALESQLKDTQDRLDALERGHVRAGMGGSLGGSNVGLLGLGAAIVFAATRRKKDEKQS